MLVLSWFSFVLCIFSVFGNEHQGIGKRPGRIANKKHHRSLNIVNGNKTSLAKYPFIASLQISQSEFGAAVILNKRWLLTTAFTVAWEPLEDLQFRVGSNSYSGKGQILKASQVIVHPNYTGSWDWDIAVVKTDKPIKLNRKVKPIELGSKALTGGTKALVAGWGEPDDTSYSPSDILLEAQVTVYDWNTCAQNYTTDLTNRLMCTFDKTTGPCVYDFGDPLVVNKVLYGLFAGGYSCSPGNNPVLYTDISSLYEWVQAAINSEEKHAN